MGISIMASNQACLPMEMSIEKNIVLIDEVERPTSGSLKEVYYIEGEEPRLKGAGILSDWNLSVELFFAIYHISNKVKAMGTECDYTQKALDDSMSQSTSWQAAEGNPCKVRGGA